MPFITEEIWHAIRPRSVQEALTISAMPTPGAFDENRLQEFEQVKTVITAIRNIRKEKNLPNKETLALYVLDPENSFSAYDPIVHKMANLSEIKPITNKLSNAVSFIVKNREYFVPLGDKIDTAAELEKLRVELKYAQGFLASVLKKLSNERFVQNAPKPVLETEYAKKADAEAKIHALESQLAQLRD